MVGMFALPALPVLVKWVGVAAATALAGAAGQWIDEEMGWRDKEGGLSDEQKDQLRAAIRAEGNSVEAFEKEFGPIDELTPAKVEEAEKKEAAENPVAPARSDRTQQGLTEFSATHQDPNDPLLGRRRGAIDPGTYRGSISDPILQDPEIVWGAEYVKFDDLVAEYKRLSERDQERLAEALFAGDEATPEGFMAGLGIESIEQIYDPFNVIQAMQVAAVEAARTYPLLEDTPEEASMIPTLRERFSGFSNEDFNKAANNLFAGRENEFISKAELKRKFEAAYGQETGRVPSEKVLLAFMKGIRSREIAGEDVDDYELSELAIETAQAEAPELVEFQRTLQTTSKVNDLLSRLA